MPASFQEILNSRLYKFTVGERADGTSSEFSIHEDAIAQLSKPLYALTKGDAPEARTGHATWKDVSKETFERFAQFAYTGDYSIPKTEDRRATLKTELRLTPPSSPSASNGTRLRNGSVASASTGDGNYKILPMNDNDLRSETVVEKADDDDGTILNYPSLSKKKRKKKKSKTDVSISQPELEPELEIEPSEPQPDSEPVVSESVEPEREESWSAEREQEPQPELVTSNEKSSEQLLPVLATDFYSITYPILAPRHNYLGTCEPELAPNTDKDQSYSKVFLSHASLYALGNIQLINSLKALSLYKLHKTLTGFKLDKENIADITDLARYAYSKENKESEEGSGGLRDLVCQYMAVHAVVLAADGGFMNLLAGGGQIVKDFFRLQLQRIQ